MLRYILRRFLAMIPLLLLITGFIFIIGQYGSGDLAAYLTEQQNGGKFDPAVYQNYRQQLHLNEPIYARYGEWLGSALHGDLGVSYVTTGEPSVVYLIEQALPISLELGAAALVVVILVGIPCGIFAAIWHNTFIDYGIVGIVTVLSSIPLFVLAPLATYFFVIEIHLVPSVGIGWHGLFSTASILPVMILAASSGLTTVRFTRASVLEVLSQEYVRAAYAKGLAGWKVIIMHVFKNALLPVLSVVGLTASYLISGSLFVEVAFNLQGFGMLAYTSLQVGDVQTITGIVLVTAILIMLINLLTDVLYSVVDPRVRLQA